MGIYVAGGISGKFHFRLNFVRFFHTFIRWSYQSGFHYCSGCFQIYTLEASAFLHCWPILGGLLRCRSGLFGLHRCWKAFTLISAKMTMIVSSDSLNAYDNGVRMVTGNFSTAGIFSTYPAAHVSVLEGFFDQVWMAATLTRLVNFLRYFGSIRCWPPVCLCWWPWPSSTLGIWNPPKGWLR